MTSPDVEERIRRALSLRAERAPEVDPPSELLAQRRAPRTWQVAAAAAVVLCLGVVGILSLGGDESGTIVAATPGDGSAPEAAPQAEGEQLPRLGFDSPGFKFKRVEECSGSATTTTARVVDGLPVRPILQSFASPDMTSALLFIRTVTLEERSSFGLLNERTGEAFTVRGTTGYAARDRSGRGWNLSLELPDGRAIYAIVLGVDLADVTSVLDGLAPRDDGGWTPANLPAGMHELPRSESWDGCYYSAWADLPDDEAGAFEINLYNDTFDGRLSDRVASTFGAVRRVTIDGVPALAGDYDDVDTDHWVLFEPQPGRTMEIRASNMSSVDLDSIIDHARFVDEATWQLMKP